MNIEDISTQLLYTTVPILSKKKDNSLSSGTGFIFSIQETEKTTIPLLVTNYHVLESSIAGFFELHIGNNGSPTDKTIRIQFDNSIINSNKLNNLDLIAIPLAPTLNNLQRNQIEVFFRSVDPNMIPSDEQIDNFSAMESITFIGYPSALYDSVNKIPIIRQGITATPIWNNYAGNESFLIDAGVFPGSSGSPVFVYNQGAYPTKNALVVGNRLFFVGVIKSTLTSNNKAFLDLGEAINCKSMYRELMSFVNRIKTVQ